MRKNILFTAIVIIIAITSGYSQRVVKLGIRGGLNISKPYISGSTLDNKLGFHAGPTLEIDPLSYLGINTGVYFSTKGFKFIYKDNSTTSTLSCTTFGIEIPATVEYKYQIIKKLFATFVEVGPYVNYGLNGVQSITIETPDKKESHIDDYEYNDVDYGIIAGGGLELSFLKVGISYSWGLAELSDMGNMKNRVMQLYVALR